MIACSGAGNINSKIRTFLRRENAVIRYLLSDLLHRIIIINPDFMDINCYHIFIVIINK